MEEQTPYRFSQSTRTETEKSYVSEMETFINDGDYSGYEMMQNFPLFVSRQQISKYLARYRLFEKILEVHGSIIEAGCLYGGGLMWMAQLSSILEPSNWTRKLYGFDTFNGIEMLSDEDKESGSSEAKPGGFKIDSYEAIQKAIELYDSNRAIGHLEKVTLIKGDACETIPKFIERNEHLIVAMLVLDLDVYAPTKTALEHFVPRMPKGGVIIFDEINNPNWVGETKAVLEQFNLNEIEIKRFPWTSTTSYTVL